MGREDTRAAAAVELAEVIEGLRNELEKARNLGEGKPIRFGVKEIELELHLTIAKQVKGTGNASEKISVGDGLVKYLVGSVEAQIALSGEGEYRKVAEQKIKLTLSAESPGGQTTRLSGSR